MTRAAIIYQHATSDRDKAIADALGDLAQLVWKQNDQRSGLQDYPSGVTDDDRGVRWHLRGFGSDDSLCSEIEVSRDQIATLRHLFDRGDDEWLMFGEYPVPLELWPTVLKALGSVNLITGVAYFIGATTDVPPSK